jgi:hypothetical protein
VLFGGDGGSGSLSDTWAWDGTTWTQLSPATSPPYSSGASMAYDTATGNMVLLAIAPNEVQSETWIYVTPIALTAATDLVPYKTFLAGTGGTAPFRFTLASGTLPPGMVLKPTGKLTGTPTKGGPFSFAVKVTDATRFTYKQLYTLAVYNTLYVVSHDNNNIVKLPPGGGATTVATPGLTLNQPNGAAIDQSGNLYISDTNNNRIVEVSSAGVASVFATGLIAPERLSVDAGGDVYVADTGKNRVLKITRAGIKTRVGSGLSTPWAAVADNKGNVYIADSGNNRIVEVSSAGTQTVVPTTGVSNPDGVALDPSGNLLIADYNNNRIVEINLAGGGAQTVPITGLNHPNDVTVDGFDTVYVSEHDVSTGVVAEYPASGGITLLGGVKGPVSVGLG